MRHWNTRQIIGRPQTMICMSMLVAQPHVASENLSLENVVVIFPTTRRLLHQGCHRIVRRLGCARCHCASLSKAYPQCEEEGLKCNPSSSDIHIAVEEMVEGLGVWRACLPTPSGNITHTTNIEQMQHDMLCPDASNPSELLSRCTKHFRTVLTCTSKVSLTTGLYVSHQ